jgi:hypothetical protein
MVRNDRRIGQKVGKRCLRNTDDQRFCKGFVYVAQPFSNLKRDFFQKEKVIGPESFAMRIQRKSIG